MIASKESAWQRVSTGTLTQYELVSWIQHHGDFVVMSLCDPTRMGGGMGGGAGVNLIAARLSREYGQTVPAAKLREALRTAGLDGACLHAGHER